MPAQQSSELKSLVYHIAVYNSESSYKKMFAILFNRLFRLALCMLKSRELAEEVASDVMFKLWQKRWELLQVSNIPVYALVIARNLSLNLIKQQAVKKLIPFDEASEDSIDEFNNPEQMLINTENNVLVNKSIDALPTRCRLVFKMIREEGLSYKEVGEILNISPKTVDAHLVTAMKKLAASLREHFQVARSK